MPSVVILAAKPRLQIWPPPTAAEGERNRACSDCRAATAEAELVPQIRLGGGFGRNPQGDTVLDYRSCKIVSNRLCEFLSGTNRSLGLRNGVKTIFLRD